MTIAHNPQTGETLILKDGEWQPTSMAVNPSSGEKMALDETGWVPVKSSTVAPTPSVPFQPTTSDRLQQVAQGGTFGLSDEMGSGIAATMRAVDKGTLNDWNSDYTTGVTGLRQDMNTYQQQRPLETMGLQLVGGLPATLLSGSAVANGLRGSNLATRMAASGAAGATSGGAYGFGTGEGQGRLQSAGQGALVGGVLGAALPSAPAAGNAVAATTAKGLQTGARGVMARSPEVLQQTAENMKNSAGGMFNQMRDIGAVINEAKTSDLLANINSAIKSKQFIAELNPKTLAIVNHIKEAASEGTLGINDLDQYRRLLSRVGNSEDGVSAGTVRNAIDSTVNSITENDLSSGGREAVDLLNQARPAYSKAMKFKEVTDLVTKADGDPNRTKAAFQRFTANDENKKGFSLAEWDALKKAGRTGIGENFLKMFGKFGVDFSNSGTGNTVLPVLMGLGKVGGAALVPGGLPAVAAATLARQGQKYIARGKAENALRMIEGRDSNVIPFQQPPETPAPTLMLEGPKAAYVVGPNGEARKQTLQELTDSLIGRQNAVNIGMTPDVSRVSSIANTRNNFGDNYQNAQAQLDAIKQQQIAEMFSSNKPSVNQMVGEAMQSHKDLAQATGNIPTGTLGEVFLEALKKQKMSGR